MSPSIQTMDLPQWSRHWLHRVSQGVDVTASRVSTVLRGGSTTKKNGSVDVDTIKKAAEFVKAHSDVDEALKEIKQVGEFITKCGNDKKALAALEA